MAEQEGRLVGFSFSIPDWCQKERGEPVDTVVYKTLAVRPGRSYAGLGSLLSERTNQIALELGYKNVIHALMHDSNHSRKISDRFARTIRRYTLYAKRLNP
jgi:GNAT superfamily N-acetyltransferase